MIQKFLCWLIGHKRQYKSEKNNSSFNKDGNHYFNSEIISKKYEFCPRCGERLPQ